MPALSKLDVINDMLAALGETPLNALDEGHPYVGSGLRMLSQANMREQAKSWWFNNESITLTPDANGNIILPADTIRLDPKCAALNYVQRGNKLYKQSVAPGESRYKFTKPISMWLVRELVFEDLPPLAQTVVSLAAQVEFQKFYDADQFKYKQIKQEYAEAYLLLNAEHIRVSQVNLLNTPSLAQKLNNIAGPRPYSYSRYL